VGVVWELDEAWAESSSSPCSSEPIVIATAVYSLAMKAIPVATGPISLAILSGFPKIIVCFFGSIEELGVQRSSHRQSQ